MLGDRVRVVSRPAPRLGDDASRIVALEFRDTSSTRALIRPAKPDECFPDPGTRVRIWLRIPPTEVQGLLSSDTAGSRDLWAALERIWGCALSKRDDDRGELLRRLIEVTAPTLDVNVTSQIAVPEEQTSRVVVVRANDWLTIPFVKLLERLKGGASSGKQVLAGTDEVLRMNNGRAIARLAVSRGQDSKAVLTIGGFATEAGVQGFSGALLGHSPNLTRASGQPWMDVGTFRDWLKRVEDSLAIVCTEFGRGAWYASLFLEFELRPTKIACFLLQKAVLDFDGLAGAELPDTLSIVLSEDFRWTLPNGEITDIRLQDAVGSDHCQLDSGVILAPVINTGLFKQDRESWPRWRGADLATFHAIAGRPFPWTLPLLAVEAVAKNWGLDPEALVGQVLNEGDAVLLLDLETQIGTYSGEPIKAQVLTLNRSLKSAESH
jgi:hypothetical protein